MAGMRRLDWIARVLSFSGVVERIVAVCQRPAPSLQAILVAGNLVATKAGGGSPSATAALSRRQPSVTSAKAAIWGCITQRVPKSDIVNGQEPPGPRPWERRFPDQPGLP
jgi:hypothetical protein